MPITIKKTRMCRIWLIVIKIITILFANTNTQQHVQSSQDNKA